MKVTLLRRWRRGLSDIFVTNYFTLMTSKGPYLNHYIGSDGKNIYGLKNKYCFVPSERSRMSQLLVHEKIKDSQHNVMDTLSYHTVTLSRLNPRNVGLILRTIFPLVHVQFWSFDCKQQEQIWLIQATEKFGGLYKLLREKRKKETKSQTEVD